MGIVALPFCDFLGVTFPGDTHHEVSEAVLGVCTASRGHQAAPGEVRWDGTSGLLRLKRAFGVSTLTVSGAALAALRRTWGGLPGDAGARSFDQELLSVIGSFPHRVTKLHATLDVLEDARQIIPALFTRAKTGTVCLTRKAIPPSQVSATLRPALYGAGDTGTVYLGQRQRDVWCKVYDKRNELLDRAAANPQFSAFVDPGPLTRYEVALGRHVGCTLRDVADPGPVFWHHMAELLPRPPGVAEWVAHGAGYTLPPRPEVLPAEQLKLLLESSPDIRRAVALADRIGPEGRNYLASLLRRLPVAGLVSAASQAG